MSNEEPPELPVPQQLATLIRSCEIHCVVDCCGIHAFDFSPLYIAAHVQGLPDSDKAIEQLSTQIDELEQSFTKEVINRKSELCSVEGLNEFFSKAAFKALVEELRTGVSSASVFLDLNNRFVTQPTASEVVAAEQRTQN